MTHQYKSITAISKMVKPTSTWDRDTAPENKTMTKRFKEALRPDGQHSPSTVTSSRVTLGNA